MNKDEYQKLKKKTDDKNKIITTLITKGYRYEDIKKIRKKEYIYHGRFNNRI